MLLQLSWVFLHSSLIFLGAGVKGQRRFVTGEPFFLGFTLQDVVCGTVTWAGHTQGFLPQGSVLVYFSKEIL